MCDVVVPVAMSHVDTLNHYEAQFQRTLKTFFFHFTTLLFSKQKKQQQKIGQKKIQIIYGLIFYFHKQKINQTNWSQTGGELETGHLLAERRSEP